MDRAEKAGFGVAVAGHVALLAMLSVGFVNVKLPPIQTAPMEVEIVPDLAPQSSAPNPARTEAAPKQAEVQGPVEP
ncbi:MAG: cell envelope biosis protein TolA, partial [Alphaproteobacteria bacterium]|nr:cell envelope biosis protein TolA [Alphaproteobacteria bacterium]